MAPCGWWSVCVCVCMLVCVRTKVCVITCGIRLDALLHPLAPLALTFKEFQR